MYLNPEGMLLGIDQEHRVHHIRRDQHIFYFGGLYIAQGCPNKWLNLLHQHQLLLEYMELLVLVMDP